MLVVNNTPNPDWDSEDFLRFITASMTSGRSLRCYNAPPELLSKFDRYCVQDGSVLNDAHCDDLTLQLVSNTPFIADRNINPISYCRFAPQVIAAQAYKYETIALVAFYPVNFASENLFALPASEISLNIGSKSFQPVEDDTKKNSYIEVFSTPAALICHIDSDSKIVYTTPLYSDSAFKQAYNTLLSSLKEVDLWKSDKAFAPFLGLRQQSSLLNKIMDTILLTERGTEASELTTHMLLFDPNPAFLVGLTGWTQLDENRFNFGVLIGRDSERPKDQQAFGKLFDYQYEVILHHRRDGDVDIDLSFQAARECNLTTGNLTSSKHIEYLNLINTIAHYGY